MATRKQASDRTSAAPDAPRPSQALPSPTAPVRRRAHPEIRVAEAADSERRALTVDCHDCASEPLWEHLRARVIGQEQALDSLVCSWARLLSGLRDPSRPLLTALLLGPTGVGKTETALALAEALFGTTGALIRINCEEYAQGHEVAKLLGSPPGYVGADIEPLLSQQRIDRAHGEARKARAAAHDRVARASGVATDSEGAADLGPEPLIEQVHDPERGLHSILLFDEIEKAHPTLWNALLGVLEGGQVTLGNNRTTDLTRSIILMTSNVGSREMSLALDRRPMGFLVDEDQDAAESEALQGIAATAARSLFPAEFINRFDEVLVYDPLGEEELEKIFDKFLAGITERALAYAGVPLLIRVSEAARDWVIEQGTEPALGARPLRRAMERLLVDPLSRLLATEQVAAGDVLDVELEGETLAFYRLPRRATTVVA